MKQNLLIPLLCLALAMPVCTAVAQEAAQEGEQAPARENTGQEQGAAQQPAQRSASQGQGKDLITVWINKIIGYASQIGNLFGKTLGFRIGGTTGTAIAALLIAKLAEDKMPSWLKWALYLTGGTMAAGSGANIAQLVMRTLGV
jgi:hypothetical protein